MNEIKNEVFNIAENVLCQHIEIHKEYCGFFKKVIANQFYPLDLRWNLYLKYGRQYLPISDWLFKPNGISLDKYSLYDDFHCDRYATITVDTITKRIETSKFDVDMDLYKESWLQEGIWGFINSW